MNDADFEAQKARIDALIGRWADNLGLFQWRLRFEYVRAASEMPEGHAHAVASCHPDWRYLYATLTFNCEATAEMEDDLLEQVFIHELMHIFLAELRTVQGEDERLDHEERVATLLAKAFQWVRNVALDEVSEAARNIIHMPPRSEPDNGV